VGSSLNWVGCTDPAALPGHQIGCVSFDSFVDPRQVRVRVPSTSVSGFFGGVYGYGGTTVSAAAVASLGPVEFTPECGICVLGAGPHIFSNAQVRATQADISFKGDVALDAPSRVTAVNRTVFLEGDSTGFDSGFAANLVVDSDPVDDPLDSEPPPDPPPDPPPAGPPLSDPCVDGEGAYVDAELPDGCVLPGGTYVFTGALTAASGATIRGNNVQIWLQGGGSINLSAASTVILDAPTDEFLLYAPSGTPNINLFGTTSNSISGHIYAPGGSISGRAACGTSTIDGLIVVAELDVNGRCLVSTEPTTRTTAPTQPPVLIR
jgi:hypothetical protein